ncbi:MAG: hypothetical protein KBA53_13990 [Thermoclostridium sp.]|nr:hypothetical protein [Thermoclostridium sp.]
MDRKQQGELNSISLEQQLEAQPEQQQAASNALEGHTQTPNTGPQQNTLHDAPDNRVLGVGEWMITLLLFLLPIVNIIVMAIWAFSSTENVHRKNFSRACLLWIIILLLGYVVAMTVAGYTIFDIFAAKL